MKLLFCKIINVDCQFYTPGQDLFMDIKQKTDMIKYNVIMI